MGRSKIKALIILFLCAYAIISCVVSKVSAEDITTGNLLPNAGDENFTSVIKVACCDLVRTSSKLISEFESDSVTV